jgi:16S rRNA (cytidine1402-2'-O)-methyltransferase
MLILLPNFFEYPGNLEIMPAGLKDQVQKLDGLIAESEKSARRFLIRFLEREKADLLPVYLLNEHTEKKAVSFLLEKLKKERLGLVSDAGMPSVADPGESLVFLARKEKIKVETVFGPSAIFKALILSGLPAESFSFEGYLPREEGALKTKIKELEAFSLKNKKTVFFIETPYRNQALLEKLLNGLKENTTLAIALDLFTEKEKVLVETVKTFKKQKLDIHKKLAVFLFYAPQMISEAT